MNRPPVVVVLGHVDHGKTTLLDYIRKSDVANKEAGNITQKIGGYETEVPIKGYQTNRITFIDTPGHEAFSALRLRGANVADIAILLVDATASVQPQTIESISHILQAKIPYVVAANKIDMPSAQIDRIKKDLAKHNVLTEGFGGSIPIVPISAKTGQGVNDLLEAILYLASESNLTFEEDAKIEAYVVETHHEKAGLAVACIIKNGTMKVADTIYAGDKEAKIRSLISDRGISLQKVLPSAPFVVFGFKEMPLVGVKITEQPVTNEAEAVSPADQKEGFDDFFEADDTKKLRVIIRADSQGSLEAILPPLLKNGNIEVVLSSVGEVAKSDIFLARISKAIIIGFNTHISKPIEKLASEEKVIIKTYNIIYNLFEELEEVSTLLKEKESREKSLKGEAKIQAVFTIENNRIAGVKVNKGRIDIKDKIELYRGGQLKAETQVTSIKQRAKAVKEVKKDQEAGLHFEPELDIQAGDVIKSYSI